jgi:hypothetical protein
MSVSVSIRVRRGLVELADKMVSYGIARSRSHAFNIMIEKGAEYWGGIYRRVEELEERGFKLRHGGLSRLLEEGRSR